MNKTELQEKRMQLAGEAEAILEHAKTEQRYDLLGDEQTKFDGIHAEIEKVSAFLARIAKQETIAESDGRRSEPNPIESREQQQRRQAPARQATHRDASEALRGWLLPSDRRTEVQREAARRVNFALDERAINFKLPAVAMRSLSAADVEAWRRDNDEYRAALAVGSPPTGGNLVPDAMMQALEKAQLAYSDIRSVARVIRTDTGAPMPFPTVNDTATKGVLLAENTVVAELEPTFGQLVIDAFKFSSKSILVSVEFLQDAAIDAATEIGRMLGERIGRITNDYFTTGTGVAQPKGVAAAAFDSGVTGAGAALYTHDELIDVIHAVDPAYRAAARFMFADAGLKMLQKIKVLQYSGDLVGAPLWQPGLTAGAPNTILGYPYVINQSMAAPGAGAKDLLFGDFSKYLIRDVRDVTLLRLDERYADFHQVGFLAFSRSDGDLLDAGTHPIVFADHA